MTGIFTPPVFLSTPFRAMSLMELHTAGYRQDPRQLFSQFKDLVKDLRHETEKRSFLKKWFVELWQAHDDLVPRDPKEWKYHTEYLDPERPLLLDHHAAEIANVPARLRDLVIALHHQIRKSLASEEALTLVLNGRLRFDVRFQTLEEGLPLREGTLPVSMAEMEKAISHYQKTVAPLDPEEVQWLREALIKMRVVQRFQKTRGWTTPAGSFRLSKKVFPAIDRYRRARLLLLHGWLAQSEAGSSGDSILKTTQSRVDFPDLLKQTSRRLDLSIKDLFRGMYGTRKQGWIPEGPIGFHRLSQILKLFNFLSVQKPWEILYRLFPNELNWAFSIRRNAQGSLSFETDKPLNPSRLKETGLGPLLSAARIERGWTLEELGKRVAHHLGRRVEAGSIGHYLANRKRPEFELLCAMVEVLNDEKGKKPVSPAAAFLAWQPTFLNLLPVVVQEKEGVLICPGAGPYLLVPYPSPPMGPAPRPDSKENLDPKGLPFLLRSRRLALGLTEAGTARKWGIASKYYCNLEKDPEPGKPAPHVPGQLILWVATRNNGFPLTIPEVLQAHLHSYWRNDPIVQQLLKRTFREPVFIDRASYPRLEKYVEHAFQTPGEILYGLRNSENFAVQNGSLQFPVTAKEMAKYLRMSPRLYDLWEANEAVPAEADIDWIVSRLRLSTSKREEWLAGVRRLKDKLLNQSESARMPPSLCPYPGISRLLSYIRIRPFHSDSGEKKFLQAIQLLNRCHPASLVFLDRIASGLEDPSSEEFQRIVTVLHKTSHRVRTWPQRIQLRGPVAAFYYFHGPKNKAYKRLTALLRHRRTLAIEFDAADGSFRLSMKEEPRPPHPAEKILEEEGAINCDDRRLLLDLLRFLKRKDHVRVAKPVRLAGKIRTVAENDPASFRDFMRVLGEKRGEEGFWERKEWDRIRRSLYKTEFLIRSWSGEVQGDSRFAFYYGNATRKERVQDFHKTIANEKVEAVLFSQGEFRAEVIRIGRARGFHPIAYSYQTAQKVSFLPCPANHWGEKDFHLTEEEVCGKVLKFFERIEKRLGKKPIEIQREFGFPDYYKLRSGRHLFGPEYLSDPILERMGLREEEKEEIRHLTALLSVIRDLKNELERGPYCEQGMLFRYFRILHQVPLREVEAAYQGEFAIESGSDIELGRVAFLDRERIREVAKRIGVPKIHETDFVDNLHRTAGERHEALVPKVRKGVTDFPDDSWSIPHDEWSEAQLMNQLREEARKIRGGLARFLFGKKMGLSLNQIAILETKGRLTPETLQGYVKFLRDQGKTGEARKLILLRTVLDLKCKETSNHGGFFRAGRLLRFTRSLMPGGMTIRQLIAHLNPDLPPLAYTRMEWGFNAMPPKILRRYADLLVEKEVLTTGQKEAFILHLEKIYGF